MSLPSFNPETYELSLLYARAVDRGDPSIFDRIFTEDAQLIYGDDVYSGREEVKRTTAVARQLFRQTLHYMVNHLAELDGDRGTTETYCMAQHISHDEMLPMHLTWYLRYVDDVVRIDGQWRIRKRVLHVEFNTRTAGRLGVA